MSEHSTYYRVVASSIYPCQLDILEFEVVRETECYLYIQRKGSLFIPEEIKIGKKSRSTPYKPTLEQAFESFIIRSEKYLKILRQKSDDRTTALNTARKILKDGVEYPKRSEVVMMPRRFGMTHSHGIYNHP